jgi:hypothetical protein
MAEVIICFNSLKRYCEKEDFKGYDVGDGIASLLLTKTFLNRSAWIRFIIAKLTGHRIAYINIRPLLFIPKFHNAKGVALFLNGYCNLYDIITRSNMDMGISKENCIEKITYLAGLLLSLQNKNFSGAGWGYPTGWQGRSFYFPPSHPTVVATSFAVEALFHAYDITNNAVYRETALSSAQFVLNDLHRTPMHGGFMLSYSSIPGNSQIHNASMLGARILSQCYAYSNIEEYIRTARQIIQASVNYQSPQGAWTYGLEKHQTWIDNFHTGYNLEAIQAYQDLSKDCAFQDNIIKGLDFMLNNHFEKDCTPKYFHNRKYPIDIHCCGEIFVVLHKLKQFDSHRKLAQGVFDWTMMNMWNDKKGFFYFQKRKFITNKTPLMRWGQAFMFNALSYYLKSLNNVL